MSIIIEKKAPKDWETFADFARCYDLVLFNNVTNLVHKDNNSYFEQFIYEYLESLQYDDDYDPEDHDHEPEPFQWYAIACSEYDMEFLNKYFDLGIFYSTMLDLYILPIYHFGTSWSHVELPCNKLKK